MPLPAVLIAAGLVITQASGALTTGANIVVAIDKSITAVVDLKKYVPQVETYLHPVKPGPETVKKKVVKKTP